MIIRMASSWSKIAAGLQLVAQAAVKQASADANQAAVRVSIHAPQILQSMQHATSSMVPNVKGFQKNEPTSNYDTKDDIFKSPSPVPEEGAMSPTINEQDSTSTTEPVVTSDSQSQSTESEPPMSPLTSFSPPDSPVAAENRIRSSPHNTHDETPVEHLPEGEPVPSSRAGRAWGFAQLGWGLAYGTARYSLSQLFSPRGSEGSSSLIHDANADLLARSLCRLRGAALKMGQMLSIQDESLLPPPLARALHQVRQGAEAMPYHQLEQQLESQLGKEWRDLFVSFDTQPFAAASIGQVHRGRILDPDNETVRDVVVKVQYPGVARSIESDLRNLSMLVTWTGLAPKGLFIENVIRVGTKELKVECDYQREMRNQVRIKELVESDPILQENGFMVPGVFEDLTTEQILTSEFRQGGTIDKAAYVDQEERNRIGRTIMYLTMKELFVWRFMQTDPNWGNFLYDVNTRTTSLIDFGATREFSKEFVDGYLRIVWASANRDEETLMEQSHRMKFLTGDENEQMLRAHKLSGYTVGEPFQSSEPFDFRGSKISSRLSEHTSVFLRHRLTPPPEEVYTLHRKLAGAYMLCIKLGAKINCRDMLQEIVANHNFEDGLSPPVI